MNINAFINLCIEKAISFSLERNDQLKVNAAPGVLTPDIIGQLKERKLEIINWLKEKMAKRILPRSVSDKALRLSYAQQRMWLLDQIDGGNALYNVANALKLTGTLNTEALTKAFSSILERHESLRTCFGVGDDGEPFQIIQAAVPFKFQLTDLSDLQDDERQLQLAERVTEEFGRVFDLSRDLMLRAQLIKLADDEHIVLVTMHHIVSDGWSTGILIREFSELYSAYVQGHENPLAPLPIQYADYAHWQRNWLQGDVLDQQLNYWTKQLANLPLAHSLPLDHARPPLQTFAGKKISFQIDIETRKTLIALCQAQGATLFMGLHAAFSVLLSRYSNETDIVVGSPIANREQAEVADVIGFFVNTLVLRSDLSKNPSFTQLLTQSKNMLLDAYAHQQVPFEQIVERLQPERSLRHSALFQVMLILQNNEQGVLALPELTLDSAEFANTDITEFDLTLEVSEREHGLKLDWKYNTDLFEQDTITRMANHFGLLLNALVTKPNESVFKIEMLSSQERQQLLVDWNDTQTDYPKDKCIHELFETQAESHPNAIAVVFESQQLTYSELNQQSNQLAHYLINEKHVTPDTLVGICVERSLDMVVGILATLKAGGAYVPLDPEYPEARLKYMQDDSQLTTVLTQRHLRETTPISDEQALCLDSVEFQQQLQTQSIQNPNINTNSLGLTSNNLAYVIYTSGSTGNPKGVMVEHSALVNRIDWMNREYGSSASDRILQKTPFSFDVSVWEFLWPLSVGAGIVLAKPDGHKDPMYLSELIREKEITKLHFVPSMLGSILLLGDLSQCSLLRQVFCSGEALALHHVERFKAICPWVELHNLYGPTEAAIDVSYWNCTQSYVGLNSVPIGRPINNIQLHVLNSQLKTVPQNVAGELHIGGVGLARGYLNRPELTTEKFIANPFYSKRNPASSERLYKTGDLVRWLPNGELEYLGRIDHQVKIRGFRIELGEIENTLSTYSAVKDTIVLAKESATGDKRLVAYVVTDSVDVQSESENAITARHELIENLRHHLNETLPDYMVPSAFVLLDSLPLTANGKVDRKALPEPDVSAQQHVYVAPRTDTEKVLCDIWQDVLGIERVGITDNFFQLGGHSLSVLRLISVMNTTLTANIKVRDVFAAPTITELIAEADFAQSAVIYQQLENGLLFLKELQKSILEDQQQARYLPTDYEDFYPLSAIQQSMVFFAQSQPEAPLYHDQFPGFVPAVNFDLEQFQRAITALCASHPILRSSFDVMNFEVPLQVVHPHLPVDIQLEDLTHLSAAMQQQHIEFYCHQDLQQRFGFQIGEALWRMRLFVLNTDLVCYVLSVQHAILDGWSVNAMIDAFMQYYDNVQEGVLAETQPLHSYKDYVAINLARSSSDSARLFWQEYLKDYSRMKLPFNYAGRPISADMDMQILRTTVSKKTLQALQHRARQGGYTVKELCLAAHVHTLSLLTGDTEILTGVVTHDRPELPDAEKILGCFLNTIPLRLAANTSGNKSALLDSVHQYLYQTKEHELFLGEIARLVGERNASGNPLFDTIFNFTDFPVPEVVKASEELLTDESSSSDQATDQVSDSSVIAIKSAEMTNTLLDIEVHKRGDVGMMVQVKYSPRYFHAQEMETVLSLYLTVLEAFANEQNTLPSTQFVSNINARVTENSISTFNQTDRSYQDKTTLHQLFEAQVLRTPDAVALRQDGKTLSYAQLNERANQIGRLLLSKGVQSGDQVGLIIERSFDLIATMFGILKVGAAYVPMEPTYPLARKQAIEHSAQLSAIVVDPSATEENARYIRLHEENLAAFTADNLAIDKSSHDLAYIIYTSGSTGKPKGVRIAHHAAVNLVSWVNREFAINSSDILLFITSVCFDLSVYDIFGVLSAGGSIVIAEQDQVHNPAQLFELIKTENITFWDSVPTTLNHLMGEINEQAPEELISSLRLVFLSGDWIPVHLPGNVKQYFPNANVISLGGATEGTVWSNYYPIPDDVEHRTSIPYGKPIDNNRFYILDNQQHPVINGVVGELYIAGVGVADGYQNDSERTAKAFFNDPFVAQDINGLTARMYKTGDLGRLLPCGNMELHGRVDHQIKLRGFRIELGEIESVINQYDAIKEAVVSLVTPDIHAELGQRHQYLVAYIVATKDASVSTDLLTEYLSNYLPEYMVPRIFVTLDELPLTQNGKVDRKALPVPDIAEQVANQYVAPTTDVEKALCTIWQEVLKVERVGITDNFFQLGGDSLRAVLFVGAANKLGLSYTIANVLKYSTIEKLIKVSPETKNAPAIQDLVVGEAPLSAAQQFFLNTTLDRPNWGNTLQYFDFPYLDKAIFEAALLRVLTHHDGLRAKFIKTPEGWKQYIEKPENINLSLAIEHIDLSQVEIEHQASRIDNFLLSNQGEMNLLDAPLIRVKIFYLGEQKGYVGRVNTHHLLIDGYSSRIFFDDWIDCYGALISGKNFKFPNKTASTFEWIGRLIEDTNSPNTEKEIDYWFNLPWHMATKLQMDHPERVLENTSGSNADIPLILSKHHTDNLFGVASKLEIPFVNLLIAVLAKTLANYTQGQWLPIRVLDAGRGFDLGLDASRTLGWLSVQRTLMLKSHNDLILIDAVKKINEQIESIPNKGFGFELIQSYHKDESLKQKLAPLGQTELFLNFHGIIESHERKGPLPFSEMLDKGIQYYWIAPLNINNEKFTCNARVLNGQLNLDWRYSQNLYEKTNMIILTNQLLENFISLADEIRMDKDVENQQHKNNEPMLL